MKNLMKVFAILLVATLLSACGGESYDGDFSYDVHDFSFTDQNGDNISNEDLEGSFWIAEFIYTNCPDVCMPMTANMSSLQSMLKDEGLDDVNLVSFSIDPDNDTYDKMEEYVTSRGGSLDNWYLFTGYDFKTIKELSIKSFKSMLTKPDGSDDVIHGTGFFIITPEGHAIKKYDGTDFTEMQEIVKDLKEFIS